MQSLVLKKWLLLFGCWTVLALIFASQSYVHSAALGHDQVWGRIFLWTLADWYIWAALSPLILQLARGYRFTRQTWGQALLVHIPAAALFALIHLALQAFVQTQTGWAKFEGGSVWLCFLYLFTKKIHLDLLTYAAIVGTSHAALYYRRSHEREAQAHKLEAALAQAQLQSLQMQLQPHFLFNTLHTLSELIHRDARAADRMVARLGELLRLTLERGATQEVTLRQELEFLQKYLELQQTRFHDRLAVEIKVRPETLDARVPNMILQPLVENALKHGLAALRGEGRVEIEAERRNGSLCLLVRDNGTGLGETEREGVGLRNTRQRLAQLYDGQSRFELRNRVEGGVEAALTIPFHLLPHEG
jgi:two-component system, LytTR family, sensor kinase